MTRSFDDDNNDAGRTWPRIVELTRRSAPEKVFELLLGGDKAPREPSTAVFAWSSSTDRESCSNGQAAEVFGWL